MGPYRNVVLLAGVWALLLGAVAVALDELVWLVQAVGQVGGGFGVEVRT